MSFKRYSSAISFLLIIVAIYLSFWTLMPKKISTKQAPLTEFSTERAFTHLKAIAREAHYVNTDEHKKVKNYIVSQLEKLGLEVSIQQQVGVSKKWRAGTDAQNILARIKGTDSSKALMLLTHYDSGPHSSLGASDAGSGVITILEGLRAFLATGKKPKNDLIILISDAEELGLLGASAFVNNHPWAKDVGLVLNFEARGSGGPSYMLMETNGGNEKLIQHFTKANPQYPVTTSLMYSVYKMIPNDTDLTVFRADGDIEGFNFAFIDDHFDYHTAQDTPSRLDKTTLEHQGTYLMPLLHYFANQDISNLKSDTNHVYFNAPIFNMVSYPYSWILPMLIIVIICFIGFLIYGVSKKKINGKQALKGFLPFLISALVSGLVATYGWVLLTKIHPQYNDILQGFTYNGHQYIAAFSAFTLAISFFVYTKYAKKIKAVDLLIAPLFIWIVINVLIFLFLQGAAYFIIAAFYGIIVLAVLLFSKKPTHSKQLLFTVLSIPILLLFVPLVQMFPVGLGLKTLAISSTFIVLLFGLLIPVFALYKNSKKLSVLFAVLTVIILVSASFKANYNENRKKPNSIIYLMDIDQNEAYWATYDRKTDAFTKQFFGEKPTKGFPENNSFFSKYKTKINFHATTTIKKIPEPIVEINYDTIIGEHRNISMTILPQRRINKIELKATNNITFTKLSVNDVDFQKPEGVDFVLKTHGKTGRHILSYYITNDENVNVWMSVPKDQNPNLTLYEISNDLLTSPYFNAKPLYHINPREDYMMPKPFIVNDAIILKKHIDLNQE